VIIFIPHYYYLHYETFNKVKNCLLKKGVESYLLFIPKASGIDETETFNESRFLKDNFKYKKIHISKIISQRKPSIIQRLFQYINIGKDLDNISNFIKDSNPSSVIIGSHLGGIYIRHIQVICSRLNIPVYSIWINFEHSEHLQLDYINRKYDFILRHTPLKNIYKWNVKNSFSSNNTFFASGKKAYNQLLSFGFNEHNVNILPMSRLINRYEFTINEPNKNGILIISEVIHEVLGVEFTKSYIKDIAECCSNLNLHVLIKFHPRETDKTKEIYLNELPFAEVIEEISIEHQLSRVKLAIGMYSKFLETLMVNNIPVISYNPTNRKEYSIFDKDSYEMPKNIITNKNTLYSTLVDIDKNIELTRKNCDNWLKDNDIFPATNWDRILADNILNNLDKK
jgi:hypothetical protein